MQQDNLMNKLSEINAWWKDNPVPSSIKKASTHRAMFYDLRDKINEKRIMAITGPRQVGKTTMMGQLIEHQISNQRINPKYIIYLPVDNSLLKLYSQPENILISCLELYARLVIGQSLANLKDEIYVYLDEIQDLDGWDKLIKSFHDMYPNIHFIVTGSSHSLLQEGIQESLVGRINIRTLLPLKFKEFVMWREGVQGDNDRRFNTSDYLIWPLKRSFSSSINNDNPAQFYKTLLGADAKLAQKKAKLKKYVEEYLIIGGFPHSINAGSITESAQILKQDLELTVYKDVHMLFNTRDPEKLMLLLTRIAERSQAPISLNDLAKKTSTSWAVIDKFVKHFNKIFLINNLKPYLKDTLTTKKDMIRFGDNGMLNSMLSQIEPSVLEKDLYRLVCNSLSSHLARLKFNLTKYLDAEIYYWEDANELVEFVIDKPKIVPVSVSYQEERLDNKLNCLKRFMDQNGSKYGIIVTKEKIDLKDNIIFIPLWVILLIC